MKIDLQIFLREEVDELTKKMKLKLFRTSVREDFNVDQGIYLLRNAIG